MLSKKNRLKDNKIFQQLLKQGKQGINKFFVVKKKESDEKNIRIGIIVSTKVSKNSTDRNKIKRRIREILRKEIKKNNIQPGDYVVIARQSLLEANYDDMKKNLLFLLKYLNEKNHYKNNQNLSKNPVS